MLVGAFGLVVCVAFPQACGLELHGNPCLAVLEDSSRLGCALAPAWVGSDLRARTTVGEGRAAWLAPYARSLSSKQLCLCRLQPVDARESILCSARLGCGDAWIRGHLLLGVEPNPTCRDGVGPSLHPSLLLGWHAHRCAWLMGHCKCPTHAPLTVEQPSTITGILT